MRGGTHWVRPVIFHKAADPDIRCGRAAYWSRAPKPLAGERQGESRALDPYRISCYARHAMQAQT